MDSSPVARSSFQMLVLPDWLEKKATRPALFDSDGNPRSAGPWVIGSEAPVGVPRFKSKGRDQISLLLSRLVKAKASPDAQDTSSSIPAPPVNRLGTPATVPACEERPISHRFWASPLPLEKITVLVSLDQQDG